MKAKFSITAIAAVLTLSACATGPSITLYDPTITVTGPADDSVDAALSIYELVVRNLVASEPGDSHVLLSFGESWIDHVDPPEVFFDRLSDLDVAVLPVSERERVDDPHAVLLELRILDRPNTSSARVSVTRFRYGVGASDGHTAAAAWSDGDWRVVETSEHWGT